MPAVPTDADTPSTEFFTADKGLATAGLIISSPDKKAETQAILNEISRQSATQIDREQAQIRNQLEELRDNRLQRYFQGGQGQQMVQTLEAQVAAPSAPQQPASSRRPAAETPASGPVTHRQLLAPQTRSTVGSAEAYGRGAAVAGQLAPAAPQVDDYALDATAPGSQTPGTGLQQYVAKGTYSLPVTLPEGEVRLDFARSAGDAALTIWAIPQTTIRNLCATAAVIVVLLIALAIIRICPAKAAPISGKRAIVYFLLFVVSTVILGLLGLTITIIIILAAEALRARNSQRATTAAA
jgi:hypothetical protein